MRYEPRALILSLVLVIGSACLLIFPFSPELNTDIIFDDEVAQESIPSQKVITSNRHSCCEYLMMMVKD